jgi:uncharacterized membrane protein required for colicin V production
MWLDVLIVVIFVLSTVSGYRRGFVNTFVHTLGWLMSLVLGFVWYPKLSGFLLEKTDVYDSVHKKIAERVSEHSSAATDPVSDALPDILKTFLGKAEETIASVLADGLSGFIFQLISFLLVVIAIRMLFLLLSSLFSKKHNEGLIGFGDGLMGLVAGSIKGIVLIHLLLALMVPMISLSSGDLLTTALAGSRLAGSLYDNNLLLLIWKDAF